MGKSVEIINAIMTPANKLLDAVTSAIGKAYEPRHIRKMAEAKAYEISTIGQALRDNVDIEIQYDKGALSANTNDFDEFVKRTQSRLGYQELMKQRNIESVTDKAYALVADEKECSEEPVNKDWMIRFFNSVEDISDEDMQQIWAKLLAGEIKRPKTFSLRTLESLKNMSNDEAELFETVGRYIINMNGNYFIPRDFNILEQNGIEYGDLMVLYECGLISAFGEVSAYIDIPHEVKEYFLLGNGNISVSVLNDKKSDIRIRIPAFPLTIIGEELYGLLNVCPPNEEIQQLAEFLTTKYPRLKILVNEIKEQNDKL